LKNFTHYRLPVLYRATGAPDVQWYAPIKIIGIKIIVLIKSEKSLRLMVVGNLMMINEGRRGPAQHISSQWHHVALLISQQHVYDRVWARGHASTVSEYRCYGLTTL
jgi:hypothetical protein